MGKNRRVRIIGVDQDGAVVFERLLGHGEDPTVAGLRHGYATVRPLAAQRSGGGLELRLSVARSQPRAPAEPRPGRDPDLMLGPGETPRLHQRVAAYAIVTSSLGLLATEYSGRTGAAGRWGLPGGGIDAEEDPRSAVLREVIEETSQAVQLGDLVEVHSGHWVGRSPGGDVEDFHAVRLIYAADCPRPTTPHVLDVGGTTASARWVPLDSWSTLRWTAGWRGLVSSWIGP